MIQIIIIDVLVAVILVWLVLTRGLERTLPFFVFVMIFFPIASQVPLLGWFNLTTQRIALSIFTILFFLLRNDLERGPSLPTTPLRILLVIHILWCLVSTANSIVPLISFKQMLSQVIEYYLMYYILLKTISKPETIHKILGAMVFAVTLACVFGSYEAYTGWRVTQLLPPVEARFHHEVSELGRGERIQSTFSNYSLFGSGIAFALIDAIYLQGLTKSNARRIYLWIAMLLMFLNIYKTMSRGPWLALLIGFFLLFFFCKSASRKQMIAICALVGAIFIMRPGVYDTVKNIYLGTLDTGNPNNQLATSYEYRYALIDVGKEVLARDSSREIWGFGLESFYYLHIRAPFMSNPEYPFESCDNAWVQLMVETGYVGLLIVAVLLIKPAFTALGNLRVMQKPDTYLYWILLINMIQYYFMMTNLALYSWGQTGYMLWIWIAMCMVYKPLRQRESTVEARELKSVYIQEELVAAPQF